MPEQRRTVLEQIWADGSLKFRIASFSELFIDPDVREEISAFVRDKMRARLGTHGCAIAWCRRITASAANYTGFAMR